MTAIAGHAGPSSVWRWVRRNELLAVGLIMLTVPTLARAHAQLVRSTPAARGILTAAPDRVQLWFNENLEPAFARVSVWSAAAVGLLRGCSRGLDKLRDPLVAASQALAIHRLKLG